MSIDPAIAKASASLPKDALTLADLADVYSGIFVFDFDGVIIGSDEDDLYNLPAVDGEDELLGRAAETFGMHLGTMDLRYRRHVLYQAAAFTLGLDMERGSAFDLYRQVAAVGRAFVLTARSGFYAIERTMRFFRQHDCLPVEQFNVGRVGKNLQLQLMSREFPAQTIYFVEDNVAHLACAADLRLKNLRLVHAHRTQQPRSADDLRHQVTEVLMKAMASRH